MHAPWTIALLVLGSHLVGATTTVDSSCGTCETGYVCKDGKCMLDTARLTGNPLPILTSDNPGGPIKTTGLSATTDATSTGEAKTTSAAAGTSSTAEAKTTSVTEIQSSTPSMTSVASTGSPAASSSSAAAATSSGAAGSLSMGYDSWVAWGVAWAVGLPLVA